MQAHHTVDQALTPFGRAATLIPRPGVLPPVARASGYEPAPTITAVLDDGPLRGRRIETEIVEGRPPSTIDVPADGGACRYCLEGWVQSGPSAVYTFLYRL
jgi:hypothetical protein